MFRLHGMDPQEGVDVYGLWQQHLHADDRAAAEDALRSAIGGTTAYKTVFRVLRRDGSVHHLRASGHVTCNPTGTATRVIGANRDVTESVELAAELALQAERVVEARDAAKRANQAKSRFLAGSQP